jgi:hypothetical protein
MSVAACGGGGPKLNSNETARAFASLTTNPLRENIVCRDVGNTAPGWDYRCWYTIRPKDGSGAFRFDSYVKVDEDSITDYTTN